LTLLVYISRSEEVTDRRFLGRLHPGQIFQRAFFSFLGEDDDKVTIRIEHLTNGRRIMTENAFESISGRGVDHPLAADTAFEGNE
jgi:hypothetical protein